ncbi:MAG: DUF6159 family protein [Candidatus Gracilibacteria bacterium]|nr:DUF6159 family protein [Candidatus Gracilibacteria bacterium]MDD2908178.1 DUF6159 family protein [Candidatus Gracilibacteria bacterium]
MFSKFFASFELIKIAFSYVRQEGELFVYALLSFISSFIILASFAITDFFYIEKLENISQDQKQLITYGVMFIFYLVFYFITFFFNTAIITSVKRKLNGEENKFGDGIRDSMANLGKILQWALVSATVALILRIIESKFKENSTVGKLIVKFLGGAWSILTFFAFPMMILQNKGPIDSVKESSLLFKKTWGEMAILNIGSGLFYIILMILSAIICFGFVILVSPMVGIILFIVSIVCIVVLNGLTDVIITTLLFHYASSETVPENKNERLAFARIAKIPNL